MLKASIVCFQMTSTSMNIFNWRKNLMISEKEPTYKVRYLGNVQTAMMKGEGCVDKPVGVIWNNYLKSSQPGLDMKLTMTASGLKAVTKEQGITEYRAHRISYCIAHPQYPRLFIWVYRHEGKKMKLELRCHAVLCKSETKAKAMALQLHEKIKSSLKEFMREKTRKQNSRLVLQRTNSLPHSGSVLPLRAQMLSTGQKFKPPISKSNTAPRLGSIFEDAEHDLDDTLTDMEDNDEIDELTPMTVDALTLHGSEYKLSSLSEQLFDLEIGNDLAELQNDGRVQYCMQNGDSDDESSESGFHEQDGKEGSLLQADDTSLDGEVSVCDLPSGDDVEESTVVTSL